MSGHQRLSPEIVSPPRLSQTLVAVFALLMAMISVTTGAAVAKGLFGAVGPEGMVAMRNGFAALFLLAFWRPWRGGMFTRQQALLVGAYGVNLAVMNLLYYHALQTLPLGLAVAIEFIGPFSLALFNSRRLGDLVWLLFAVAGLGMLLPIGGSGFTADPVGVAYALGAGAAWALYIIFGQKAGALLPSGRITAIGTLIAALFNVPVGIAMAGSNLLIGSTLLVGMVVALFSSAIPYSLDMVAMKRLPTRSFGILMSVEPAIAALIGFVFLSEDLSLRQQLAIACVIVASFGSTASARKTLPVTPEL